MRPTRWYVLVAAAAAAGFAAYLITSSSYESLPAQHVYSVLWILLLATAEFYVARMTRARLAGRPGTKPIHPLSVARLAAMAKASSLAGAVVGGGYAGFFIWVVQRTGVAAANNDAKAGAAAVAFGLLLTVAALFLESVCRVPEPPEEER